MSDNKNIRTRTYYTVKSFIWDEGTKYVKPYWRIGGYSPGGNTVTEARSRVCEEIKRLNSKILDRVKFTIVRTVETEEDIQEFSGSDLTALILKS